MTKTLEVVKFIPTEIDGEFYEVAKLDASQYTDKVHTENWKMLISNVELSKDEIAFVTIFKHIAVSPSNVMIINHQHPTFVKLAEVFQSSEKNIIKTARSLKKKGVIHIFERLRHTEIFFNPFLVCCGDLIDSDLYGAFKDSIFNPFIERNITEMIKHFNENKQSQEISSTSTEDKKTEITRTSPEYTEWRKQVLERDGYQCVLCGSEDDLHAHHLDGYKWAIDQRVELENGRTLCKAHHKLFHSTFGSGANTKREFEEFSDVILAFNRKESFKKEITLDETAQEVLEDATQIGIYKGYYKAVNDMNKALKESGHELEIMLGEEQDEVLALLKNVLNSLNSN